MKLSHDGDLAPQAAGLLAISLGLSHNVRDDHEQLRQGFVISAHLLARAGLCIDALYGDLTRTPLVDGAPERVVCAELS